MVQAEPVAFFANDSSETVHDPRLVRAAHVVVDQIDAAHGFDVFVSVEVRPAGSCRSRLEAGARARAIGLDRVLITGDLDNVGSARVIESPGGVLDGVPRDNRRYWVAL